MLCSLCSQDAILYLPYAQRHLCQSHFDHFFVKRFRSTIREFKMIQKNDRIAVGLSGGKDSTVLLHLLHELQADLPFELIAITIDEGISGYRSKTLDVAKHETQKLGIEHKVFSYQKEVGHSLDEILKKKKENRKENIPCSYCGVIRRRLLNQAARDTQADKLAIGHNLDDMAQSIFMNIMRNEPQRLARLNEALVESPHFVSRIRPLLRTPEKEVAIYALTHGMPIDFQECPYARYAFRAHVREQLNETEERYPGTKFRIVNSFLAMEPALKKEFSQDQPELTLCVQCKEPAGAAICAFCTMMEDLNPG